MTLWQWAGFLLLAGLIPCGVAVVRGAFLDRLIALNLATTLIVEALLVLTVAYGHDYMVDVALTLIVLLFPGSLLFAHFREHWL
jgi:multisubunit Na+/H+ antiporter MnhF subunit